MESHKLVQKEPKDINSRYKKSFRSWIKRNENCFIYYLAVI